MRDTIFVIIEKAEDIVHNGPNPLIFWTNAGEGLARFVKIGLGFGAGFLIAQVIRGVFVGVMRAKGIM